MPYQIRRINPTEAAGLRAIRLRALLSDPSAFGSSYERESGLSPEEWIRRANEGSTGGEQSIFVADGPEGFVAMAGAYTPGDLISVRRLYGMWVAPESRSAGLGQQLIEAITTWSISARAAQLQLWVVDDNLGARQLYARAGFRTTRISQPLPSNPALTETLLELSLEAPTSVHGAAPERDDQG